MGRWTRAPIVELIQLITPDDVIFDLTTEAKKGNWVLEESGWGMPPIDYISQQGPFQHGVSVRDYRLKPRTLQLLIRQQACDRDAYWERRTQILNGVRPNRITPDMVTGGAWVARSQARVSTETTIASLVVFQGGLYGGASSVGILVKWNDEGQWIEVAPQLGASVGFPSLIVYDDGGGEDLYGGTQADGKLYRWNGTTAWVEVAAQLNAQTHIYDMVLFDDGLGGGVAIFGGTGGGGRLFKSVGAAWSEVAAQLGAETQIRSLAVFDDGGGDDIYGGTRFGGRLFRWTIGAPGNWGQVLGLLNAQTLISSLVEYNGSLYGGTFPGGRLFRADFIGATWVEVAGQYGAEQQIASLIVYQGRLYGTTSPSGLLLRWNNANAWELVANQYGGETSVVGGLVFNNRLFGGSGANEAYLLEYIRRAGDTKLPCATLRRVLSDGSIRDLCVHILKGPEFTPARRGWDKWAFQEVLRFWAPDPIIYDPDQKDGPTYTMDPTPVGTVNETQTLTYEGTWEEHPQLNITGPINNPIIRNEDTDEHIELDYNIAAGRVVTIILTPGNQTVEDDLGTNLIGSVTPESNLATFHLAADPEVADGDNDISIQGTGTNAATDFVINYYLRYIGI